jgi:molybdopterin-synthase adenylyltransferase
MSLTAAEQVRYDRQLMLPEIGETGQVRLKAARVFIAGLGGLGSVSAGYLAAAGVGYLRIVDSDRVELGNLNRQILHRTPDIGKMKTDSAVEGLSAVNPACHLDPIADKISIDNVVDMVKGCTLILDATDNIQARKALNRASIALNLPFIYAGIDGFSGMLSTFVPKETPCFECLFPNEGGKAGKIAAMGPIAGLVASLQCLEAMKMILNLDGLLTNRLLIINGRHLSFREISIRKNRECTICD